jgi:DNA invertase Pin-like site-specific DNA recombinase
VSVSTGSDSLQAQADAIRMWAAQEGHEVVAEFADDGVSGAKGEDERAALANALAFVEDGGADGIVCHRADRLARQLHLSEAILARVWAVHGRVFCVDGGEVVEDDASDPMRVFCRQVLAAAAQLERGLIVARMQGGRRRKAAAGGHIGGSAPFGYQVVGEGREARLVAIPEQQAVIEQVIRMRAGGETLRSIASTMGWSLARVQRVLRSARKNRTE